MRALIEACREGRVHGEPSVVIGSSEDARAIVTARTLGVPVEIVSPHTPSYGERLVDLLARCDIGWVCLAGYLSLLPVEVIRATEGRVLNIHPSLLPKFGGKGMYGLRVHEAVLAAGERESGCTVHFVSERYDEGDIVLQKRCPVRPDDTPESLADRVLKLEHTAYAEALNKLIVANGNA